MDSSDVDRLELAKSELQEVMNSEELEGVPILVLGNKVDKQGALHEDDLRSRLGLDYSETSGKNKNNQKEGTRRIEVFMCSVH